jgi:spermidine synthase
MVRFCEDRDLAINLRNLRRLAAIESAVQKIELFQHPSLGKILKIDGEIQHVERWQALYHEPLVHLPSTFVPEIKEVLVLGGGSLFAAFEVLRYSSVTKCTLVDHDPAVIELMVKHYPHAAAVIKSPRFSYVQQNAISFLRTSNDTYDLVLNDCFDSLSVSAAIKQSVFQLMSDRLARGGVCADPIYRHIFENSYIARTHAALKGKRRAYSLIAIPEYPGVMHVLACWGGSRVSQSLRTPINRVQRIWQRRKPKPPLEFYDPRFLSFYLYLPPYLGLS